MRVLALEQNWLLLKSLSARYRAHLVPREAQSPLEMLSRALAAGEGVGWDPIIWQRSLK